jgi:hypothetical protein
MKPTKQKMRIIKEARKIERNLQISLGTNYNRHRVHASKKTYNRKNQKNLSSE